MEDIMFEVCNLSVNHILNCSWTPNAFTRDMSAVGAHDWKIVQSFGRFFAGGLDPVAVTMATASPSPPRPSPFAAETLTAPSGHHQVLATCVRRRSLSTGFFLVFVADHASAVWLTNMPTVSSATAPTRPPSPASWPRVPGILIVVVIVFIVPSVVTLVLVVRLAVRSVKAHCTAPGPPATWSGRSCPPTAAATAGLTLPWPVGSHSTATSSQADHDVGGGRSSMRGLNDRAFTTCTSGRRQRTASFHRLFHCYPEWYLIFSSHVCKPIAILGFISYKILNDIILPLSLTRKNNINKKLGTEMFIKRGCGYFFGQHQ